MEHIENKSPFLIVVLDNFNARMQDWYQHDITIFEEFKIDMTISQFSLFQTIKESTHLSNSASCITLIFTFQPNLVKHSGVHPSLHPSCHHQIVLEKFSLTIFYPPLYKRLVWHHQQANTDLIKRAIVLFDWKKSNLNVNKQVSVFNEMIMKIFEIFIRHKKITCKYPPWMNKQIIHKQLRLIAEKNALYKRQKQKTLNYKLLDKLDALQAKLQSSINFFSI